MYILRKVLIIGFLIAATFWWKQSANGVRSRPSSHHLILVGTLLFTLFSVSAGLANDITNAHFEYVWFSFIHFQIFKELLKIWHTRFLHLHKVSPRIRLIFSLRISALNLNSLMFLLRGFYISKLPWFFIRPLESLRSNYLLSECAIQSSSNLFSITTVSFHYKVSF